jgi:Mg-chelatase subunit ChlD
MRLFVFLALAALAASTTLNDLIAEKEAIATDLASAARGYWNNRCSRMSTCECSTWACGNEADDMECSDKFGTADTCPHESGTALNFKESFVRIPPGADGSTNKVKETVCAWHQLDTDFQSQFDSHPDSKWMYVAGYTGVMRQFPGGFLDHDSADGSVTSVAKKCTKYDPRIRPWYVSASSGPKDVVFVLDTSGSMGQKASHLSHESRMDVLKEAAKGVIGTLTMTDFTAIVKFSSTASVINRQTTLIRADDDAEKDLKNAIKNALYPEGATNFRAGLGKAFDILIDSINSGSGENEHTSGCDRIIIFLTDGDDSIPGTTQSIVNDNLATQQNRLTNIGEPEARIFTFAMGSGVSDAGKEMLKQIACRNGGVFQIISDGADPLTDMSSYYKFLAAGITTGEPRWSTPYVDFSGLGLMTTVGYPFHDPFGHLIGVAATDVLMSELEEYGSYSTVINRLIAKSQECPSVSLTACQMQFLRAAVDASANIVGGASETDSSVCPGSWGSVDINSCGDTEVQPTGCSTFLTGSSLCSVGDGKNWCELACCKDSGADCHKSSPTTIVVVVVGCVLGVMICAFCAMKTIFKRKSAPKQRTIEQPAPRAAPALQMQPVAALQMQPVAAAPAVAQPVQPPMGYAVPAVAAGPAYPAPVAGGMYAPTAAPAYGYPSASI